VSPSSPQPEEREKLIAELKAHVEMERWFGGDLYRSTDATVTSPASAPAPTTHSPKPQEPAPLSPNEDPEKRRLLEELRQKIQDCQECALGETRTKFVFGTGRADARLMFVGEAPGRDEDLQGEPFVGRAGKLLTKMIEAMGLQRADVYIGNILKCRPPDNRTPSVAEMAVCLPYIRQQIEIIEPEVVCALGATALKGLLGDPSVAIGKMRGRFLEWNGLKLMPTYHPAYLLRSPGEKRKTWADLQKIMVELGLPLSQQTP
jgi:uracil-DNA glycosylase